MSYQQPDPAAVCAAIRESAPYMAIIYTHGGCWHFHKVLRSIFPQAKPFYVLDGDQSHVYTEIDGRFYDVNARHPKPPRALPFDNRHYPRCEEYRERWWCALGNLTNAMEKATWPDWHALRETGARRGKFARRRNKPKNAPSSPSEIPHKNSPANLNATDTASAS